MTSYTLDSLLHIMYLPRVARLRLSMPTCSYGDAVFDRLPDVEYERLERYHFTVEVLYT